MHVSSGIILFAAAAAFASARPTPSEQLIGKTVSLVRRGARAQHGTRLDALLAIQNRMVSKMIRNSDNIERNTGALFGGPEMTMGRKRDLGQKPASVIKRSPATHGLDLQDIGDGMWWAGEVSVGTPPQTFQVDFDTASSDFWTSSAECKKCETPLKYQPHDSTTAVNAGRVFNITYVDDSCASGPVWLDTVSIGGLVAENQAVAAVNEVAGVVGNPDESIWALMGMAWPILSRSNSSTFMNTLSSGNDISASQFSFSLNDGSAELYIGGVNPEKYQGEFRYIQTKQDYWRVPTGGLSVNGQQVLPITSGEAIIDTGSSAITASLAIAEALYKQIPDAIKMSDIRVDGSDYSGYPGWYAVPCNFSDTVSFNFAGESFDMASKDFLELGPVPADPSYCIGGLIAMDIPNVGPGIPIDYIIGGTFLQSVYTTFDITNVRVGFAKLASSSPSTDQTRHE